MPKHVTEGWPEVVGVRRPQYGADVKTWWAAFKKWSADQGWQGGTLSHFIREAIQEKVDRVLAAKSKKGKG